MAMAENSFEILNKVPVSPFRYQIAEFKRLVAWGFTQGYLSLKTPQQLRDVDQSIWEREREARERRRRQQQAVQETSP